MTEGNASELTEGAVCPQARTRRHEAANPDFTSPVRRDRTKVPCCSREECHRQPGSPPDVLHNAAKAAVFRGSRAYAHLAAGHIQLSRYVAACYT